MVTAPVTQVHWLVQSSQASACDIGADKHSSVYGPAQAAAIQLALAVTDTCDGQVTSLKLGNRVASAFTASCGGCFNCQHELTCRCEHQAAGRFGYRSSSAQINGPEGTQVRLALMPVSSYVSTQPRRPASQAQSPCLQ